MTQTNVLLVKEVCVLALPIAVAAILVFLLDKGTALVIWVIGIEFGLYLLQLYLVLRRSGQSLPVNQSLEAVLTPLARHFVSTLEISRQEASELSVEVGRLKIRAANRKNKMTTLVRDFRDSLSALPDAIIALDRNNRIEWWNKAAGELVGLSGPVDQKKRIEVFFLSAQFREYIAQDDFNDPIEMKAPTYPEKLLSIRITPYGDNQRLFRAEDITLVKQLESVRQDFVANASHELRTPLTVVHGYLETLIDQKVSNPEQVRNAMEQMHQQTTRIKGIVEDMLTLAHLERGETAPKENVDIEDLVLRIRSEAISLSGEKAHAISTNFDPGYFLTWNPEEVHSLFSNLVINAVKYTPPRGEITLDWSGSSNGACFSVQDTGIGIEKSHISRLTERFYRVDVARSRESGGTGLGLAIVKHILGRMGGDLEITSEPGVGSLFICHFPADLIRRSSAQENMSRCHNPVTMSG